MMIVVVLACIKGVCFGVNYVVELLHANDGVIDGECMLSK